jgi:hypothetical protein
MSESTKIARTCDSLSGMTLQRLVDGELGQVERSAVLSSLADDSIDWKVIALAFIEKQILMEAFSSENWRVESAGRRSENVHSVRGARVAKTDQAWRGGSVARLRTLLALAAGILLGLGCGWFWIENRMDSNYSLGTGNLRDVKGSGDEPIARDDRQNSATQSDDGQKRKSTLTSLTLEDALARSGMPISVKTRRELMKHGYVVRESKTPTEVLLPTGIKIEVPVRHIDVDYLGAQTYQ